MGGGLRGGGSVGFGSLAFSRRVVSASSGSGGAVRMPAAACNFIPCFGLVRPVRSGGRHVGEPSLSCRGVEPSRRSGGPFGGGGEKMTWLFAVGASPEPPRGASNSFASACGRLRPVLVVASITA